MNPIPMQKFENIQIILGSKSPRRQELLKGLDLQFEIRTKDTEEIYPEDLDPRKVPAFLAELKAEALLETLSENELLITSDTIVLIDNEILGKPESFEHAVEMLQKLSGKSHDVITGVHLRMKKKNTSFSVTTKVLFKPISEASIRYYIEKYKPYDKAGSYGVQEWIGYTAIDRLEGSYFNVMGLPVAELWEELQLFLKES